MSHRSHPTTRTSRTWKAAAGAGVTAIGLTASVFATGASAATALPQETGAIPAGATLSGVADHGPAQESADFGTWRGAPVQVVTDYLGGSTWSSIANTSWTGSRWAGTKYHYVWSMFMLPSDGSGTLAQGATGAYNSYFVQAAQGLVANGYGSSTIRLGWENTGSWYLWSITKDPASYAAYWRQIVTAMRSVPGANFTFDFNISDQGVDPTPAWPGDAYVDYIGGDFYDQSWAWSYTAADHVKVWNHIATMNYGLNWLATFAAAHGKRVSLSEWGLAHRCDGHGGEDDPYYVQAVHDWVASHNVAYEAYFNDADSSCQSFQIAQFPQSAALYQQLQSGIVAAPAAAATPTASATPTATATATPTATATATPTPTATATATPTPTPTATATATPTPTPTPTATATPTPTPTPTNTATIAPVPASSLSNGLYVGWKNDRSDAVLLNGALVSGPVYIHDIAQTTGVNLKFVLDGTTTHNEGTAPYDWVGGTTTTADSFDANSLSAGTHTMVVTVTDYSGKLLRTDTATFTVVRPLSVSTSADRSNPAALAGQSLSGPVYVFDPAPSGTTQVQFFVDGVLTQTEGTAPFDLAGGTTAAATAYQLGQLAHGKHTITATETSAAGTTKLSSVFYVA